MSSLTVFFLLLLTLASKDLAGAQQQVVCRYSAISASDQSTIWLSPSSRFAFGFFKEGSGFKVGIWLVDDSNDTIVWTAQRDDAAVSSNAILQFTSGRIMLASPGNENKFITPEQNEQPKCPSMLDSGNLVIYNEQDQVIWRSFDFPTDTILEDQFLHHDHRLYSNLSPTNHSTGRYSLIAQSDGNLVAYPAKAGDTVESAYWDSDTDMTTPPRSLYLNSSGAFVLVNDTDLSAVSNKDKSIISSNSSLQHDNVILRLNLRFDGNLVLYSHSLNTTNKSTTVLWQAIDDLCDVSSSCGVNTYCTRSNNQPLCKCLPGTENVADFPSGCQRNSTGAVCIAGKEYGDIYDFASLKDLRFKDVPYFAKMLGKEECLQSCLEDCDCDVALFDESRDLCRKYALPLSYTRIDNTSISIIAFFKVKKITGEAGDGHVKPPWTLILGLSLGFFAYSSAALALSGIFIFKFRLMKYRKLLDTGRTGLTKEFTIRAFTYNELKRATNGFKKERELGKGSFGAVYKGTFDNRSFVAVKRLEKVVEEGEREFKAEVRVIGRTRHKNLVRLLGFCAEGSKRILVYEYMSHGSLADLLFRTKGRLDWNERVRIALDVARGICYLHQGCEAPIIHCDIKPQNILLDESWTAKISDFGLAKLLQPDQTRTFTGERGTLGYMAPEWKTKTAITLKVDIYSYGIVLLEIICRRRHIQVNLSRPEETHLPSWAYNCFAARELDKLMDDDSTDKNAFERMVMVALWCIQDEPALRPSMKNIISMLEGITDVSIPPCPVS
ncbi:G-type lectin S-receptor-like serine/threonine-protein kinase LECRK4 [Coffea arabica]|uniref:Receptor-like serine/threonine-protein kinase n=1 Tax=Coffea arabica TaxID=13443 RepID=A0A6P6THN3_COFAR|nr:G-type lectin S-receptor-like serine/threonine-protein kinase LECRK4 [Coffea arabica]